MNARSRERGAGSGLDRAALGLILLLGAIVLVVEARGLTFSGDDWTVLLDRRGHDLSVFFDPHSGQLVAGPIFVFKVLLQVFGASSYWPFILTSLAVHLLVSLLVWMLASQAVGPRLALVPAAVVVLLGPAWQDLLWAFQLGYFGSVAAGLGAYLMVARDERRADVAACLLLAVSLLFGSMGLGVAAGIAVELLLRRRDGSAEPARWTLSGSHWRRLWVAVVPVVLYLVWRAASGATNDGANDLTTIPGYVADALAAGLASITGLGHTPADASPYVVSLDWGRPLALALVALIALRFVRRAPLTPRTWAYMTTLVVVWAAAAWSYIPAREAFQSRYQYVSAVFLLLTVAELARGWRPSVRAGWVLTGATAFAVVANVGILRDGADFWRMNSEHVAAETGALEIARAVVDPAFAPEDESTAAAIGVHNMQPVVAGSYLSATDDFGSPADSPAEIADRPAAVRAAADFVLARAERLGLAPVERLPRAGATCRTVSPTGGVVEQQLAPGTTALRAAGDGPVQVRLRRFGDDYGLVSFPELTGGAAGALTIPADGAPDRPWRLQATTGGPLRLCTQPAG